MKTSSEVIAMIVAELSSLEKILPPVEFVDTLTNPDKPEDKVCFRIVSNEEKDITKFIVSPQMMVDSSKYHNIPVDIIYTSSLLEIFSAARGEYDSKISSYTHK